MAKRYVPYHNLIVTESMNAISSIGCLITGYRFNDECITFEYKDVACELYFYIAGDNDSMVDYSLNIAGYNGLIKNSMGKYHYEMIDTLSDDIKDILKSI